MAKKKNILPQIFTGLVLGSLGAAVGFMLARTFVGPGAAPALPFTYQLAIVPALVLAMFAALALHELGHVLAGISVGFEFRMYTVGPLMVEREEGRLRLKWNRNLNLFGGLALCLPVGTHRMARRFVVFGAGGPLASLLWALLAGGLYWLMPGPHGTWLAHAAHLFLLLGALFSTAIFLVTVVPMQAGGFYSDGARVLNLSKGGPRAELDVCLLTLTSQLMGGIRPRQMPPEQALAALQLPVESPFKGYLHSLLHYHYLDTGNIEQAQAHLEQYANYLPQIPSGYQASVWLDKAYFEAMHRQNATEARACFQKAEIGAVITPSKVLRAEAAVALAEGNYALALDKARKAIAELPKSMDKGTAIAEREWLEQIAATAQAAPTHTT